MRQLGRYLFRRMVDLHPWGARAVFLERLKANDQDAREAAYEVFKELGLHLGISGIQMDGDNGLLLGSLADDAIVHRYALDHKWAQRTVGMIRAAFGDGGGTYVDVGANIGSTLVPIAQDARIRCIGIEPDSKNYAHLQSNVQGNCRHGNVETRRLAVYKETARLKFDLSPDNMGDHHIGSATSASAIEVDAKPLDDIAPADGGLVVKVDTQGAEPHVVAGGMRTLGRADLVIMEFWPFGMQRIGADPRIVTDFLLAHVDEVAIAGGEADGAGALMSTAEACLKLEQLSGREYVDIIFGRQAHRVLAG